MNRVILLVCFALCVSYTWAGYCRNDWDCNRNNEDCIRNQCQRKYNGGNNNNFRNDNNNNNNNNNNCPNGWRPSYPNYCNSESDCQQQQCASECRRDWNYNANRCDQCRRRYACKNRRCCYNN